MRTTLLALAAAAACSPVFAQSTATLRGVDVYRSSALTVEDARKRFDEALRRYTIQRNANTPGSLEKAEAERLAMIADASKVKGVAWADLTITEYYTSVDHALYAVFDVVDAADASRLAFTPAPKAKLPDPDGVLAAWRAYDAKGEALSRRGELPMERPNCPGFYCQWGGTPELDGAQKTFVDAAAKRATELKRVLSAEADGELRADALFVLSYRAGQQEVIGLCQEALADSDARVRGAALQILADIANRNPGAPIGLEKILPRLDDPSGAVRGKTMGLLVPLAEREADRAVMLSAAPRLAALLRLSQPESRDLAFTLLGILSRKNFDRQDYAAWDAWAANPNAKSKR